MCKLVNGAGKTFYTLQKKFKLQQFIFLHYLSITKSKSVKQPVIAAVR